MASVKHPSTMDNLPRDILLKILVRLLAKQLAQMRCLSKSWNAFLSESSFVKSHLQYSTQNNDDILLVFYPQWSEPDFKLMTAHPRSPQLRVTTSIKPPVTAERINIFFTSVIGSVNGLICFDRKSSYDGSVDIRIWNPSLSAVLTIPSRSRFSHSYNYPIEVFTRFGFDPKTDDYKVVKLTRIFRLRNKNPELPSHFGCLVREWMQVEVYSMRQGSWQLITERPPSRVTEILDEDEVCVDGHDGRLHWLGYIDKERKAQTIFTFDLGVEVFQEIPLPDVILYYVNQRSNVIGILAKKLCVMSSAVDGEFEVWFMDEYGVAESWMKHHVFSQFRCIAPFGFTSHNEFLFKIHDRRLALYVPVAAMSECFSLMPRVNVKNKVVEYV